MAQRYAEGFESVIDFQRQRSWQLALLFYAIHFVAVDIASFAISELVYIVLGNVDNLQIITVVTVKVVATIYALVLYGLIVHSRKEWKNPRYAVGFIAIIFLGYYRGGLLALVPAAAVLMLRFKKRTESVTP